MTLTPAYGRDYKSAKDVITAFQIGHDFEANSPTASGKVAIQELPVGTRVTLRYKRMTMAVLYTITAKDKRK